MLEVSSNFSDTLRLSQNYEEDRKQCYRNEEIWRLLHPSYCPPSKVFPCVSDAIVWLLNCPSSLLGKHHASCNENISLHKHKQVFVTGSLYLVGMVLKSLECDHV